MWHNTEFLNGTELAHIFTTGISKVKKGYTSIRNSVCINVVKMNSINLIMYYHFIAMNIASNFHHKYWKRVSIYVTASQSLNESTMGELSHVKTISYFAVTFIDISLSI